MTGRVLDRTRPRVVARTTSRGRAGGAAAPVASIYDQVTAGDVDAWIKAALSSASDFTPAAGWSFDAAGGTAADFGGSGYDLVGNGATVTAVSPHGRAAPQTVGGTSYWTVAGNAALNPTTNAFAVAVRVRFTAPTSGNSGWLGKGGTASAHYQLQLDASGFPRITMKESGGATSPQVMANIADSVWRWILAGRTVAGELAWITLDAGEASAAFPAATNINANLNPFGLWRSGGVNVGGADCEVDHLLVFAGAAAESVFTNRADLLAVLLAGE